MTNTVKVWDPLVRVFHWSLVVAFAVAYLTEEDLLSVHTAAGYTVIGLVLFRIVWGFIGTRRARFSDFIYSPQRVIMHLKQLKQLRPQHYLGHNPAGGMMVLALLLCLLVTSFLGLAALAVEEHTGPFAAWLSGAGEFWEDVFKESHEFFANFTLVLVFMHVGGVILESRLEGQNLVRAMVTGRKRMPEELK